METILQAVFPNEAAAQQGQRALEQLADAIENTDVLAIGETYLLHRKDAGQPAAIESTSGTSAGALTLGGGLLGGLLGLLGGPVGVVAGAAFGLLGGGTGDFLKVSNTHNYLHEVAKSLPVGQALLVAHVWEASAGPVDAVLRQLGGPFTRVDVDQELTIANRWEWENADQEVAQADQAWRVSEAADKAARRVELDELLAKQHLRQQQQTTARFAQQQARLAGLRSERQRS